MLGSEETPEDLLEDLLQDLLQEKADREADKDLSCDLGSHGVIIKPDTLMDSERAAKATGIASSESSEPKVDLSQRTAQPDEGGDSVASRLDDVPPPPALFSFDEEFFNVEIRGSLTGELLYAIDLKCGNPWTFEDLQINMISHGIDGADNCKLLIGDSAKSMTEKLPRIAASGTLTVQFVKQLRLVPAAPPARAAQPAIRRAPATAAPPATVAPAARQNINDYRGAGGCRPACSSSDCCNCFTGDCLFEVLGRDANTQLRQLSDLNVGDVVATGAPLRKHAFRRITRIWPSVVTSQRTDVVQLAPGCIVTANHPAYMNGAWKPAASLGEATTHTVDIVYGIELEGHVDTLLVGGVVCAALGVYCGPSFGWNIFTRRTTLCDSQPCCKCDVAVDRSIDFSNIQLRDLDGRYEPY
eukprot:TRINITY_DN101452_c0_g1_i1.p1 TRINITY_DN101452_c0_g1~~TRINITY_DN101452_c0_g1_i1.p1  ORF type:complete len:414 (-),score=42.77 TRINITY_DN101452_c0_g1_i1:358-1599(-)